MVTAIAVHNRVVLKVISIIFAQIKDEFSSNFKVWKTEESLSYIWMLCVLDVFEPFKFLVLIAQLTLLCYESNEWGDERDRNVLHATSCHEVTWSTLEVVKQNW
jgi:hypothetical protein